MESEWERNNIKDTKLCVAGNEDKYRKKLIMLLRLIKAQLLFVAFRSGASMFLKIQLRF